MVIVTREMASVDVGKILVASRVIGLICYFDLI